MTINIAQYVHAVLEKARLTHSGRLTEKHSRGSLKVREVISWKWKYVIFK